LQPGSYVFRVRGSNNDNIWSEQNIAIAVTIEPPFWMTWWFSGLIALLLVGAVYAGYRVRVRSLESRSRELEKQIERRTQEINRQRLQTEALYRADEDLYRHLDLDEVLSTLINTAVQLLDADKGALLCWDEAGEHLVIRAACQFHPDTVRKTSIPRGQGVAGWVAENGQTVVIEDTQADPRVTQEIIEAEQIRALIQVPIQVGDEIFGVFSVDFLHRHSFNEDEKRLLASLAQRAAIAIQNVQLYEQAQELAANQERNRLARELHDAVTQTLFSASLIAEALPTLWERDQERGRERLVKLRQMSRGALAEMRSLLLELRPAALYETDLGTLLRQLGEAVTGREGVPVSLDVKGEVGEDCKLPDEVHIALYRIAQEALNNVVKHAQPNQVQIELRYLCQEGGQLSGVWLVVRDDGQGFETGQESPQRLGIRIMRERAQKIGAQFSIESQPGRGTRVRVDWRAGEGS
jgi:signal transduction histidine kinase